MLLPIVYQQPKQLANFSNTSIYYVTVNIEFGVA